MDTLWSMSTTIREADRIVGFLKTAVELDGADWNKENQKKFQILLIKNRQYLNDPDNTQSFNKLSPEQANVLRDKSINMTYEQAKGIFDAKEYNDPPMRGRQSMSPLTKLGLVYIRDKKVSISDVGKKLANDEIAFSDFMLDALLKFQYPNPCESGFTNWNTKPFINTLRLIKKVNELCKEKGMKEKGISKTEFGLFALSLKSYEDVDTTASALIEFRKQFEEFNDDDLRDNFVKNYINKYLRDFKNPEKNIAEYTDNMIRYLRLTKYIYIRGKYAYTYIDLEPRRMTEINSILDNDNGSANTYSLNEWYDYMGTFGSYELPFETVEKLSEIAKGIATEINEIESKLEKQISEISLKINKNDLNSQIKDLREYRTGLQNQLIKQEFRKNTAKIDETIKALEDIRTHNKANLAKKYSIELEKWVNIALNIIDDAKLIKPNAPVGDDNEPIYTAPNGVPDIECYYENFNAICEVTMLTSRDQWYNEGQPVMRHLREFETEHLTVPNYCLFVAPTLHVDTVNTFYMSVKYEYDGKPQKIIPITILQLEKILQAIKEIFESKNTFKHETLQKLYEDCTNISSINSSALWLEHINTKINTWIEK